MSEEDLPAVHPDAETVEPPPSEPTDFKPKENK